MRIHIVSKMAEAVRLSIVLTRTFGLRMCITELSKLCCWRIPGFGVWICRKANRAIGNYLRNTVVKDMDLGKIPIHLDGEPCVLRVIWIMWWQGIDAAPEIVKFCVSQIRKLNPDCEIRMLDQNNYRNYVEIPEPIKDQIRKGKISLAHIADIIRVELLAQYGGVWVDATLLTTAPLQEAVFSSWFYSIRLEQRKCVYAPAEDKLASFFMAAPPGAPLFLFVEQFMHCYFEKFDTVIDYLLIDFAVVLAGECIPGGSAQRHMDAVPVNNIFCFDLDREMNRPFSGSSSCLNSETSIFKLNWRHEYVKEVNGVETVYGYLSRGEQ